MYNLPSNYNMYWNYCSKHKIKYHASDGACDKCIDESAPSFSIGETVPGYIFAGYDNGKVFFSETYVKGSILVEKSSQYLLYIENGKIYGCSKHISAESAQFYAKKGDIFISTPDTISK